MALSHWKSTGTVSLRYGESVIPRHTESLEMRLWSTLMCPRELPKQRKVHKCRSSSPVTSANSREAPKWEEGTMRTLQRTPVLVQAGHWQLVLTEDWREGFLQNPQLPWNYLNFILLEIDQRVKCLETSKQWWRIGIVASWHDQCK